jgi:hypothetical protein
MRRDAIAAYGAESSDIEDVGDPRIATGIRCALSGEYCRPKYVNAADIVPVYPRAELADSYFRQWKCSSHV